MEHLAASRSEQPPVPAVVAIVLVATSLALAPARSIAMGGWDSPLIKFVALAVLVSVGIAWVWALYRRVRWVHWLTIGAGLIGLIAVPELVALTIDQAPSFQTVAYLAQCILGAFASALLLLPSSAHWHAAFRMQT